MCIRDRVVGVCICRENATILTVTENGKGRRSDIDTYRITARGGKDVYKRQSSSWTARPWKWDRASKPCACFP